MDLQERVELMARLGEYITSSAESWQNVKARAESKNPWFTQEFIDLAAQNIATHLLMPQALEKWVKHYHLDDKVVPRQVGIIMAGNIPLVGFHDLLSVFISGHKQYIKLSSKDDVLMEHLVKKLAEWNPEVGSRISIRELLKGCDAYIATGGNQSSRYFEQYFQPFPHIIRKSKTSIAVLTGDESAEELDLLADDVHLYFGRGCRNVTKIFVPEGYDFVPLLKAFDKYGYFSDHHKFKNNYDFQLSLLLLNQSYYMTNGQTLLVENEQVFTPISVLNYSYFSSLEELQNRLADRDDLQCVVGHHHLPFGRAQKPSLTDYADGVDTMQFLLSL